jgi:hypothetical protein
MRDGRGLERPQLPGYGGPNTLSNSHRERRIGKEAAVRIGQRFWVHSFRRRLAKADYAGFVAKMHALGPTRFPESNHHFVSGAIVGHAVIDEVVQDRSHPGRVDPCPALRALEWEVGEGEGDQQVYSLT